MIELEYMLTKLQEAPCSEFDPQFVRWCFGVVLSATAIAKSCDKREHCEDSDPNEVKKAAAMLRMTSQEIATHEKVNIFDLYADRIDQIEKRNVMYHEGSLDGKKIISESTDWAGLQQAQDKHNRYYHPDVAGLPKLEQLRHYSFHVSALGGELVNRVIDPNAREEFISTRLPDMMIFGVLIATASNDTLSDIPLPR